VGLAIADCRLKISDYSSGISQSAIGNRKSAIARPTRYREVVLTSCHRGKRLPKFEDRTETVMNTFGFFQTHVLLCGLVVGLRPTPRFAQSHSDTTEANHQQALKERDGQHDFDFEIGKFLSL
jgi:hypothetical protein